MNETCRESEMEDIQLAIALSASETHGGTGVIELEKERPKRRKQGARTHHAPPLASLTSSQVQQNIESRLGCILEENVSYLSHIIFIVVVVFNYCLFPPNPGIVR